MKFNNCIHWLVVPLVATITLCLTGCGGSNELVYRATGTATEAKVVYTDANGNMQEETVTLPWETSIEFKQEVQFELRVSNTQPTGDVKCQVLLDERERGNRESAAYTMCMGSVYVDGNSTSGSFISYSAETDLTDVQNLINDGKLEDALAKVKSVLEDAPNFAGAHFMQGLVYKNMEDLDQAIAAYGQAITLDPEYIGAYNNRGRAYQQQGELELAVADFTSALELDPEYVNGYFNRTIVLANMGDLEAAKADVLKVQELADDPNMLAWAEEALAQLDDVD